MLCGVYLFAMVLSMEFLLSISMITMGVLVTFRYGTGAGIRVRKTLGETWRTYRRRPLIWWIAIPFLLVVLTLPYTTDLNFVLERLRIKAPFALLPLIFLAGPDWRRSNVRNVLVFFVALLSLTALGVGINYVLHWEVITEQIGRGKPMPTPSNHIRFSLTVALAVLAGLALSWTERKWWLAGMTAFLFGFAHLLAVRSGLLALYLGLTIIILGYAWQHRNWKLGLGFLLGVAVLPLLAYQFVPSLQRKIDYAIWDYKQYQQNIGGDYSDSERLISLEIGWEIFRDHPVLGVGAGDLKRVVKQRYARRFPNERYSPRMPHNQLLTVLAGTGILGLLLFLIGFFYPLVYWRNLLFSAFYLLIFCSFWMENTLENNYGISLYLFFLMMALRYFKSAD